MNPLNQKALQSVGATVVGSYVGKMLGGDMGHAAGVAMGNYIITQNMQKALVAAVMSYGLTITVKEDVIRTLAKSEGMDLDEESMKQIADSLIAAASSLGVHMVFQD